jgi:hypothetical protein
VLTLIFIFWVGNIYISTAQAIKSTVLEPGGQSKTKFKKLDNNLPVLVKISKD